MDNLDNLNEYYINYNNNLNNIIEQRNLISNLKLTLKEYQKEKHDIDIKIQAVLFGIEIKNNTDTSLKYLEDLRNELISNLLI